MGVFTFVSAATSSDKPSVWPTIWAAVAAVAALAAFLRASWWLPARRLIYVMKQPLSLANPPTDASTDFLSSFLGSAPPDREIIKVLRTMVADLPDRDVKLIEVILAGRGRMDVTGDVFECGPIVVKAGGPIVGVLQHSSPEWYRAPVANTNAECLKIGPGFISRKHRLRYFLLVNAEDPKASMESALTDVIISRRSRYTGVLKHAVIWLGYWLFILSYLALVAWGIAWIWSEAVASWIEALAPMVVLGATAILTPISANRALKREGVTSHILVPAHPGPGAEDENGAPAPPKEIPAAQPSQNDLRPI